MRFAKVIGRYFPNSTVLPLVKLFNYWVLEPRTSDAFQGRSLTLADNVVLKGLRLVSYLKERHESNASSERGADTILEQLVAIKELYPIEYALRHKVSGTLTVLTTQEGDYQRGKERFIREGRILAQLNHPHVVRVYDLFEERDTAYLVMELILGQNLEQSLEGQPERKLPVLRVEKLME